MRLETGRFLSLPLVALLALAACDDDGTGPVRLAAPAGVQAIATGPASVRVSWSQVSGADAYAVDRAEAGGDFSTVGTGVVETFYEDTGLAAGAEYRYRVRALNGGAASEPSGLVTVRIGDAVRVLQGVTEDMTLHADTTYVLSGYVKVSDGATLTIEPGTRIVGDTLTPGSSLWVLRGSRIVAEGTAEAPIVFTSQRAPGNRTPGDWGGIVIIGNAPINRTADPIFTEGPTGAAENYAGGSDPNDDSGSLRYVRI